MERSVVKRHGKIAESSFVAEWFVVRVRSLPFKTPQEAATNNESAERHYEAN